MSWYKTGQINITNGSQTVVGVGTNFARFVESGEALLAPDGKHYEIATVLSATELRLVSSYTGATASAQSYAIVPVQGYVRDLAYKAADLIDAHKSVPEEALAHAEASEQSAVRAEAAKVGLEDARAQAESSATAAAATLSSVRAMQEDAAQSKLAAASSATAAGSSATNAATSATAAASSASAAASSKSAAATSESAALASKNAAAASESAALASKNAAATSASAAATSASAAEQSKIASATYESDARASRTGAEAALASAVTAKDEAFASQTSAKTSMDAAAASSASASASSAAAALHRDKARDWADKTGGEVEAGKYSARYWAEVASSVATGGVVYMGTWSAQTGAYPATPSRGHLYKVSTAGTVGGVAYSVKDMIIYNGESWDKIDTTDEVTSVSGKVGAVTLTKADVGLGNVDNTSDANKPVSTATQAALDTKAPVSHTHDASAIVSGTIADDRLPARLREKPQGITDWNTAVASGWYQGNDAANAPSAGYFIGNVEYHHERWVTQVVHLFIDDSAADTKTYRRESSDAGGVAAWGPWYRLRLSEAEQAAVTQAWWNSTNVPISKVTGLQTTLDAKEGAIAAGTTAQFWRGDKTWTDFATTVRNSILTGLSTATNAVVAATDTVLTAIGKLQAQVSAKFDRTGGDVDGNINFTGTARRITGDFSNGNVASRVSFQSSTTNSNTSVQALPNGTSQQAQFSAYNQQDPTHSGIAQMLANGSEVSFRAATAGNGFPASTFLPMTFYTGGSERMRIRTDGTVDITGNLNFPGTARRITGDFSNATIANRLAFQTSAVNEITSVAAIPNGSGTAAQYALYNRSDVNNATLFDSLVSSVEARIRVLAVGTGSNLPLVFHVGGLERLRINPTTGSVLATSGAIGYGPGAGGTVIQGSANGKGTPVALNKLCGTITMDSQMLAPGETATFVFSNSTIGTNSMLFVQTEWGVGSDQYSVRASVSPFGNALISLKNETTSNRTEAVNLRFFVFNGVTS